jgi:hypothetical protein
MWRLVDCRAWDEGTDRLSTPYGSHPLGQTVFSNGRMLVALCTGDAKGGPDDDHRFSAYSGRYSFDGTILEYTVELHPTLHESVVATSSETS